MTPRTTPGSVRLVRGVPRAADVLELLKPVTWFPPMWAFACGLVSSGAALGGRTGFILLGVLLCGPLVCGTSQAVNDWFDRHVDAINEAHRPIPSGRIPGQWGLWIAIAWTFVSALVGFLLGPVTFLATLLGLALAWGYSAPPFRFKRNGWVGNGVVGLCYEGLPWVTGAAIAAGSTPDTRIFAVALAYSIGAHGIMTLNDFKSLEGDRRMGVGSLPATLGPHLAVQVACIVMAVAQAAVVLMLIAWGNAIASVIVTVLLGAQCLLMRPLLTQPMERAPWYNACGVSLYVLGMMVTAFALAERSLL
jgi:chlorophyll synthase